MPIAVQLPGYNNNSPLANLAKVAEAGSNIYTGIKQRNLLSEQGKQAEIETGQKTRADQAQQSLLGALNDPSSIPSLNAKAAAHADIGAIEGSGLVNPQRTSALHALIDDPKQTGITVGQLMSPLAQTVELAKAKISGGAAATRAQTMVDNDAKGVASQYHEKMRDYKNVGDSVRKIESILNAKDAKGNPLITKQAIGEANLAVNTIFSPQHQSDSTVDATEYQSAPAEFAGALQKLMADPKDTNSRKIVEHIVDQAHRIGNVTNNNALSTLDYLDAGNKALGVPAAQKAARDTSAQYRKVFSRKYTERGENNAPGGHQSIQQGDHVYNWNAKTGKYE